MQYNLKSVCTAVLNICVLLCLSAGLANADVTYEGSEGVKIQILAPTGCEECHDGANNSIPTLNNYDDTADEIVDILDRLNRDQGDPFLMPRNGTKLSQPLLDLMSGWSADGVPEWSPPQLTVTGHSVLTLSSDSADLEGTLKENGRCILHAF